ncbi:antileukoproteinase-like [Tenrec ecaudatus]|uniref:antileukoproteinase-like n=1 Tax=Tenrec ecaudatus TaxID=94439 RepID=UPI003F59DD2F
MKSQSLFPLAVLLALAALLPWTVEGAEKMPEKAGRCPPKPQVMCFRYEEPQCQSDWQCPEKRKCCHGACGIKCLDPVDLFASDKKPGKCPVVNGQCMMLNPPNYCHKDGQCQGNLKCCLGMCGKVCMSPV